MQPIIIEQDGNMFTVRQEDRYCDHLGWDEMLGTIAQMTHPKIGHASYRMQTAEQWAAEEAERNKRLTAMQAVADPDFVEVPRAAD